MSANSNIEWCHHTFNGWEGCQHAGPGCDNCYAEARNARFAGGTAINWGPGAPRRRTSEANWRKPLAWNANHEAFFKEHGRRQSVFCQSLSDWADNQVPSEWRMELATLIRQTQNLDWLLLTKRIGNAEAMLAEMFPDGIPPNVWIGATICTQDEANRDIPKLRAIRAAKRFLSMEPLLGPVDIRKHLWPVHASWPAEYRSPQDAIADGAKLTYRRQALISKEWADSLVNWVIVGGESGPNARGMLPHWAANLRDQCVSAGASFLFKQWGEWAPEGDNAMRRVGKKAAGRLLDGRTWDEVPV